MSLSRIRAITAAPAGARATAVPLVVLALTLTGCSTLNAINPFSSSPGSDLAQIQPNQTPETLYNNGVDALHTGRYKLAAGQFDAIQQNYPYSPWTSNAQLMEGYAFYLQNVICVPCASMSRSPTSSATSKARSRPWPPCKRSSPAFPTAPMPVMHA
jgi:hypothetical protein